MNIWETARLQVAELRKELRWPRFHSQLPTMTEFLGGVRQTFRLEDMFTGVYFDRRNTRWIWFELGNTLLQTKVLLAQARAYKSLEPLPKNDPAKNSYLHNLHYNKMDKFNLAVCYLAKTEDLVFRLLFENIGASLVAVDMSEPGWERELTWRNIRRGVSRRARESNPALAQLTDDEYRQMRSILARFRRPLFVRRFLEYRHRLTHRLKPSVDYPELYTYLEDRVGRALYDEEGREKGRSWGIGGRPIEPEFTFAQLYDLATNTLGHYLSLLRELKAMRRFSPEAFALTRGGG